MTSGKTTPGWPRRRRIRSEPCVPMRFSISVLTVTHLRDRSMNVFIWRGGSILCMPRPRWNTKYGTMSVKLLGSPPGDTMFHTGCVVFGLYYMFCCMNNDRNLHVWCVHLEEYSYVPLYTPTYPYIPLHTPTYPVSTPRMSHSQFALWRH